MFRAKFGWHDSEFLNVWTAWSFVQAGWLKRAERSSTTLCWYLTALLLGGVVYFLDRFRLLPVVSGALGAVACVVSIVGIFVCRREMMRYFNEKDNVGLGLTIPMTLFFNTLYFQYHFHEIAAFKRRNPEPITPAAG